MTNEILTGVPKGSSDRVVEVLTREGGGPLSLAQLIAAGAGSVSTLEKVLPYLCRQKRIVGGVEQNGGLFVRIYTLP